MSHHRPLLPTPVRTLSQAAKTRANAVCGPDARPRSDEEPDEPWDDDAPEQEFDPLDGDDFELDDEPEPDDGDFWIDPDEVEDPWN